jgi:hypothetical protein
MNECEWTHKMKIELSFTLYRIAQYPYPDSYSGSGLLNLNQFGDSDLDKGNLYFSSFVVNKNGDSFVFPIFALADGAVADILIIETYLEL